MSDQDQDFFSEGEESESKTEKPAAKGTSAKTSSSKPASKAVAAKVAPKPAAKAPASSSFFDQQISVAMASLVAIVALLVGVIGTMLFVGTPSTTTTPANSFQGTGGAAAPQLTPDQLNSGQLPAGHPAIPGTSTPTGSSPATSGK